MANLFLPQLITWFRLDEHVKRLKGRVDILESTALGASELQKLNEGNGDGYRILGRDSLNYGNIGLNAVDFSVSTLVGNNGATGTRSLAYGQDNIASGNNSFVGGSVSVASGHQSVALGAAVHATGINSFAAGASCNARGVASISMGTQSNADGNHSFTVARNTNSMSIGECNVGYFGTMYSPLGGTSIFNTADRIFNVGNGTANLTRSDALTILKNGTSIFGGPVRLKTYTVLTLPSGVLGDTAIVTDATTPTYLGTLVGGGTVVCPVFFNGSDWISH